ncbi:MAG: hypothetical protein EB136_01715 [Synechococcaceae bacterium WBB_3_034]|jgi:hypothetical protein|nr:hypothetical protein [Synechococcaceae bacterium WBB_3_034]NDG22805.1 hypothetical protein [Synechococcaceae bacterium WBB_10_009]
MVDPLPNGTAAHAAPDPASESASERITEQLGRLIPLVNGPSRVARVGSTHGRDGLASLLSWDDDGQLNVD